MGKCILLIRVSTQHQDLTQQTERVKSEAKKDGYRDDDIIVLEDKESAVKLSEEERNGLNQLKWFITHDNINCVYAYEVSRISRQPATLYSIRDFLIKHNVQLVILNPYMKMLKDDGTLSETANIFFGIFSSMAENEGFIRKARMKRGVEKKKAMGLYVGGKIPMGYKVVNKRFVIDDEQAKIVLRIFNEYANDNKSLRQIARELADEGVFKTRLNAHQTICNIITKKYYCGDNQHPQIISEQLYDAAQQRRDNKIYYKKYNDALCKGLLIDKKSGYRLTANNSGKQYYVRNYKFVKQVENVTISFRAVHTLVNGVVDEWYHVIRNVKQEEIMKTIQDEIEKQRRIISTMEDNIIDNQDKIDRIEERYIEGKISKQKADELEHKVFNELMTYKQKIAVAQNTVKQLEEQSKNTSPSIMSLRDKILYVVDKIIIERLSRFVCEITIVNKWTGEMRIYEYDTRRCAILKMQVQTRPTLSPPE